MIKQVKLLNRSKFVRSVAIVASGTAGAQAINMAFSPVITRIYGPEAFGVLGTFVAMLTVLTPIAALSYPIAIVLPKQDSEAMGLAKLSIKIALIMSVLVTCVLIGFGTHIINTFSLQAVEPFILLLPLAMLFSAMMAILNQWVIRKKIFHVKAKVAVLQALWLNGAKSGIGYFLPYASVLIVIMSFGSALHALMLWLGARRESRLINEDIICAPPLNNRALAWRYRDFAYYRTPQLVLNALSQSMPVLILASLFGPAVAGLYALARLVLEVPSALIGQSVADVFYPKFVEAVHSGRSGRKLVFQSCSALFAVGIVPYLIVFLMGPSIFSVFFGSEWVGAGEFARWMSIWLLSVLATRPVVAAIPALGLQQEFLVYEIFSILIRVVTIVLAYYLLASALLVVAAFSLINVVAYLILFLYVMSKA